MEYTDSNDLCGDWDVERLAALDCTVREVNEVAKIVLFEFK